MCCSGLPLAWREHNSRTQNRDKSHNNNKRTKSTATTQPQAKMHKQKPTKRQKIPPTEKKTEISNINKTHQ